MSERLKRFRRDVVSAIENGNRAERSLVERLKTMTPEEFARVPRDLLDRVSDEHYREVVGQIAPNQKLGEPEPGDKQERRQRRVHEHGMMVPEPLRAALLGGSCGVTVLATGLYALPALDLWRSLTPPVRSTEVATWPACGRLNRWVDGCTYRVETEKDWRKAAGQLDLPETYLRTLNEHVKTSHIPADTLLIVWRERGTLREAN